MRGLEGKGHEAISYRLGRLGRGGVSAERDVSGMLWERVTADQQAAEIRQTWVKNLDIVVL